MGFIGFRRRRWPVAVALALGVVSFGFAGASVAKAAGWSTSGPKILAPDGSRFVVAGVNWYGFETRDKVAHGLYTKNYTYILDEVRQYGFNTVRIPFSNEMWETDPRPRRSLISACPACTGKTSRDILALIINYAGSIGLHVILDDHRSSAGNGPESNGLWYASGYPESAWIRDWRSVQSWTHGRSQSSTDTVTVNDLASDGYPTVLGYDLRNEPHTPARSAYLKGSTWGTGDGIAPATTPNPNPFAPACVATSTCHDWRLAAERAADSVLGDAAANGWGYPLIFVEGIGTYPAAGGTAAAGPYDATWWGANLLGVNGNSTNPGAPVVLNAGGGASGLGPAVDGQLVYSAHDYGPSLSSQAWFNSSTCYTAGCGSSSLAGVWTKFWAHLNLPGGVDPVWPGHSTYPWASTGSGGYGQTPIYIGEFGTGSSASDLYSSVRGSQGQWFTDLLNFVQSSNSLTSSNDSGVPVSALNFTYWALNSEDSYALLGANYTGLASQAKEYSFLCAVQQQPFALPTGTGGGQCGSTGPLPDPF